MGYILAVRALAFYNPIFSVMTSSSERTGDTDTLNLLKNVFGFRKIPILQYFLIRFPVCSLYIIWTLVILFFQVYYIITIKLAILAFMATIKQIWLQNPLISLSSQFRIRYKVLKCSNRFYIDSLWQIFGTSMMNKKCIYFKFLILSHFLCHFLSWWFVLSSTGLTSGIIECLDFFKNILFSDGSSSNDGPQMSPWLFDLTFSKQNFTSTLID